MQLALSASAAAGTEDAAREGREHDSQTKKKKKPAEKGTQEAATAAYSQLFDKRFNCIDCKGLYTEQEAKAVKNVCKWCKGEGCHRELVELENDNGKFRGAGSDHLPSIHNCKLCEKSMPFGAWLAYLDPNSLEFIERPNQFFEQAATGQFKRMFDDKTDGISVCIFCKGLRDKVSYIKEKRDQQTGMPTGKFIPANEWYRLSERSQGRQDPTRLAWL